LKLFKEGEVAALKPRRRGRKIGACRHLTPDQEKQIQKLICGKRPEQLKMNFALWTRGAVKDLILQKFERMIEYMEHLIKDAERKVFLILDNLRVHLSKPVKEWSDEHQKEISLFFLPSYSPELNPDECLNADLKHKLTTEVPAGHGKSFWMLPAVT